MDFAFTTPLTCILSFLIEEEGSAKVGDVSCLQEKFNEIAFSLSFNVARIYCRGQLYWHVMEDGLWESDGRWWMPALLVRCSVHPVSFARGGERLESTGDG